MKRFLALSWMGAVLACSASTPTTDGATDAGSDGSTGDARNDVQTTEGGSDAAADGTTDASNDVGNTYTLTINDYLSWCNVTVNGGSPTSSPTPMQFAPNTQVSLHGDTANASLFYWGYWQAPGLTDGGKDTNMDVSITMTGDVTILACCPDLNTPLSCP
jgi:hypothetical protein